LIKDLFARNEILEIVLSIIFKRK